MKTLTVRQRGCEAESVRGDSRSPKACLHGRIATTSAEVASRRKWEVCKALLETECYTSPIASIHQRKHARTVTKSLGMS